MERKLAEGISIIFHPVLIPFYGSLVFLFTDGYLSLLLTREARLIILGVILLMTFVVPVVMILLMKRAGIISSIRIEHRRERSLPFLGTAFAFYLAYMLIRSFEIPGYFSVFLLGATLLIVIALIINYFWKISIHMLALGGLSGTFIALAPFIFGVNPLFIYLSILVAGLTGYSRLIVSGHNPAQVYVGFLTGLGFMFSLFQIIS